MTTDKPAITRQRPQYLGADSLCDSRKANGGECLNCAFNDGRCIWDKKRPWVRNLIQDYFNVRGK
jgi:hypothetical protein